MKWLKIMGKSLIQLVINLLLISVVAIILVKMFNHCPLLLLVLCVVGLFGLYIKENIKIESENGTMRRK